MLDAYIIDRIRREREQDRDDRIPLHIEPPPPPDPRADDDESGDDADRNDGGGKRGSVVIDFMC